MTQTAFLPRIHAVRPAEPREAARADCADRELRPLRLSLALVFLWFGFPKLLPGASPAEALACATVPLCDPAWFVPTLGLAEMLIGASLLSRRFQRLGLVLLLGHLLGATLLLVLLPSITWKAFPVATLEGQYVLKNAVLGAAALALVRAHRRRGARA